MSTLSYNGIDLGFVRTVGLDQRPKTEDSGVDVLWYTYTLKAETLFTVTEGGVGYPAAQGIETTPAEVMARIRHLLLQPRKELVHKVADEILLEVKAADGVGAKVAGEVTLDANNGPRPLACDVTAVTERTFRVTWSVEVALADCGGTKQQFASNRWEQTHDVDERGYSTLVTTGTVWVRSDMRVNPDQLRSICAPPLPDNFRRKATYHLQKDGLAMRYTYTDVEKYLLPPRGTVEATMDFRITTQPPGAIFIAQCDVSLEGKRGVAKRDLLGLATAMALQKIRRAGPVLDMWQQPFIRAGAWSEEGFENRVRVSLEAQLNSVPEAQDAGKGGPTWFDVGVGIFTGIFGGLGGAGLAGGGAIGNNPDVAGGVIGGAGAGRWVARQLGKIFGKPSQNAQQQQASALNQIGAAGAVAARIAVATANTVAAQTPPFMRMGDPPAFTSDEAEGIDPGLRGNADFLKMVAAAFRDPCTVSALARLEDITLKPLPGSTSTLTGGGQKPPPVGVSPGVIGSVIGGVSTSILVGGNVLKDNPPAAFRLVGVGTLTTQGLGERVGGISGQDIFPGSYEVWLCDIEQVSDGHAAVLEATVEGYAGSKCQWANPGLKVLVKWTCAKVGFPPQVPVCVDPNLIPIKTVAGQPAFEMAADGLTPIFACSGVSEYQALDPARVALRAAIPPWMRGYMRYVPAPLPYVLDLSTDAGAVPPQLTNRPTVGGTSSLTSGPLVPTPVTGGESHLVTPRDGIPGVPPVNA